MGRSVIADLVQELVPELQASILGFLLGVVTYVLFQKAGHCILVGAKSRKDLSHQVVDIAESQTSSTDDFGEWEQPARHSPAIRRDVEAERPSDEGRCEEESGRPRGEPVARPLCKAGCVQPEAATFEEVMDMLWDGLAENSLQEKCLRDESPCEEGVREEQPVAKPLCNADCVQPEAPMFDGTMDILWEGLKERNDQGPEPAGSGSGGKPERTQRTKARGKRGQRKGRRQQQRQQQEQEQRQATPEPIHQEEERQDEEKHGVRTEGYVDWLYKWGAVDEQTGVPLAKPSWFHEDEQGHLRDACPEPAEAKLPVRAHPTRRNWFDLTEQEHRNACPEPVEALRMRTGWFDEAEQAHLKDACSEPAKAEQPSPVRRTRRSWSDETDWSGEAEQEHLKDSCPDPADAKQPEEAAEAEQRVQVRQARRSWYATTVQDKGDEAPWLARQRSTGTPAPRAAIPPQCRTGHTVAPAGAEPRSTATRDAGAKPCAPAKA